MVSLLCGYRHRYLIYRISESKAGRAGKSLLFHFIDLFILHPDEVFEPFQAEVAVRLFGSRHTALQERTVQVSLYRISTYCFEPAVKVHLFIDIFCMVILAGPVLPGICLIVQQTILLYFHLQKEYQP